MSEYQHTEDALDRAMARCPTTGDVRLGWFRTSRGIAADPSDFLEALVADGILESRQQSRVHLGLGYFIPEPPHVHEPVPYNIHAGTYRSGEAVTGEITRKCATCDEWLPSVPVKFPITLPIVVPT